MSTERQALTGQAKRIVLAEPGFGLDALCVGHGELLGNE